MRRMMGFDFSPPLHRLPVQVSFISKLGRHHEVGKGERERGGGEPGRSADTRLLSPSD